MSDNCPKCGCQSERCRAAEIARLKAERETDEHNAFIAGWEAAFRYGNPEVGLGVVADNAEEAYSLFKERTS